MDRAQRGEPPGVVAAEVAVDPLVGVDAEELADDLDGQDLPVVVQGRVRPALAQPLPTASRRRLVHSLVHEAVGGYDEGVQVHGARLRLAVWSPSMVDEPVGLDQKPAHRVSYCSHRKLARRGDRAASATSPVTGGIELFALRYGAPLGTALPGLLYREDAVVALPEAKAPGAGAPGAFITGSFMRPMRPRASSPTSTVLPKSARARV